jgi:hypothetical protein
LCRDLAQLFKSFNNVESNWITFEGEFIDGQKNGLGMMIFQVGDDRIKYHGNMKENVFHGSGTLINERDGKIILNGLW